MMKENLRSLVHVHATTEVEVATFADRYKSAICGDAASHCQLQGLSVLTPSEPTQPYDLITGELQDGYGIFLHGRLTNKSKFIFDTMPKGFTNADVVCDKDLPGDPRIMDCSWYLPNGISSVLNPHINPCRDFRFPVVKRYELCVAPF